MRKVNHPVTIPSIFDSFLCIHVSYGVMWHPMHECGWPQTVLILGNLRCTWCTWSFLFHLNTLFRHTAVDLRSHDVGSIFVANLHVSRDREHRATNKKTKQASIIFLSHLIMLLQKIVTNYARHGYYIIYI